MELEPLRSVIFRVLPTSALALVIGRIIVFCGPKQHDFLWHLVIRLIAPFVVPLQFSAQEGL